MKVLKNTSMSIHFPQSGMISSSPVVSGNQTQMFLSLFCFGHKYNDVALLEAVLGEVKELLGMKMKKCIEQ